MLLGATEDIHISYAYDRIPTLWDFTQSKARMPVALGPFGSGKSSGCLWKIRKHAVEQRPNPRDGIRRTRWAIIRNCYDDQTEVLTKNRGWQLFKNVKPDDLIATLDGDNLVYNPHDGISVFPYQGEMLGFESEGADFLVTPDHKMWVSKRRNRKKIWGKYEVLTAQEIYGNQLVRVKRDAKWNSKGTYHSLAFMEWLGFYMAEGHSAIYKHDGYERHRCVITQTNNLDYVRNLFAKAGIPYSENKRQDTCKAFIVKINNDTKKLIQSLIPLGKSFNKTVPAWTKECSPSQIRRFFKGYLAGDGCHSKEGSVRATTASKQLADDIQELALKAGMVVNISKPKDETGVSRKINGVTTQANYPTYLMTFLSRKRYEPILHINPKHTNHLKGWHKVNYIGNVYCVQMPLVPVYVRRNGKAFWCMRTYAQLNDTTIRTVLEWWPPAIFGTYKSAVHTYVITAFEGCEIELIFRALDRPDHISNLLSLELSGAWVNEAREVPWAIIDALDGRIDRFPAVKDGGCTKPILMLDSNPPEEESTMWNKCEEEKPANLELFKQPSGLSPKAENIMTTAEWEQYSADLDKYSKSDIVPGLKPDYYINLADGKQQDYIDVYIHGKYGFVKEGKPVYETTWNDALHMAKGRIVPIQGRELIIPFDFGLTPAGALMQITPRGFLNVLRELVSDGMGFQQFIRNILKPILTTEFDGWTVVFTGDPAGTQRSQTDEKTCYDILREEFKNHISTKHYRIVPGNSNDMTSRIGSVEYFLSRLTDARPTMQIDPSCKMIRKGFNKAYYYKRIKTSDERYSDEPFKNIYSHIMNAVEYGCVYIKEGTAKIERKRPVVNKNRHKTGRAGY